MARTLKIFISLILIFALHRYYAWNFLSEQYGTRHVGLWREVVVGLLSDIWVAGALSLPLWIFEYFPSKSSRSWHKTLGFIAILGIGALTAGHQSYVEFFKFQIIPFHLGYLVDPYFLKSNGGSIVDPAASVIMIASVALAYWTGRSKQMVARRYIHILVGTVIIVITTCHVLNIRWRINWYVIEPLQNNYMESLYANLRKKPSVKMLSSQEKADFQKISGQENWLWTKPEKPGGRGGPLEAIVSAVKRPNIKSRPVILGLILAESLRASDVGPRPRDGATLTPALDRLQESGVRFSNIYSSGPVTRGGQEATWCGTPSATDTSLMRSFPDLNVSCLPKMLQGQAQVVSLWAHGGDERFDSQLMFWTRQGVNRFLTKSDFPEDTPTTSWGISDLALLERTAQAFEDLAKSKDVRTIAAMILTVTNHIPWALPDDASIETKGFLAQHPSHRTIKYFDESLDLFIESLKEKNLWENSIFIVTGDHGNLEPTWREDYAGDPMKWERLLSHVSVTLTGGIIERLRREGALPADVKNFTSQSQIAGFLQTLATASSPIKESGPAWDSSLFTESPWVVFSDLNQYLFLPEEGVRLEKEDVLAGKVPESSTRSWLASVRYRGWLEFLYSSKTAH